MDNSWRREADGKVFEPVTAARAAVTRVQRPVTVKEAQRSGSALACWPRSKGASPDRTDTLRFSWIEWNLQKIDAHGLSAEEVEAAFDRVFRLQERKGGSFQMF